jgi:hypothetical protein
VTLLVLTLGLGLLLLPGAVVQRWARLAPRDWSRLNEASMRLGLWGVRAGLAMAAIPTVLFTAGVEQAAATCHELFGPNPAGGLPGGWLSVVALTLLELRMRQSRRRSATATELLRVEGWLGRHSRIDGVDVVFVPTDEPLAYAIDRPTPQVVISDGLAKVLTEDEVHAVVRHELSHLAHGHHRQLTLAAALGSSLGWLPPVRRSLDALTLGVERWADEDAAAARPMARSLVRSALVKVTSSMLLPVPSFSEGCTILDRLVALETDAPRPTVSARAVAFVPLIALAAVLGALLLTWTTYTHHGPLALLGYCPL